MTYSLGAKCRRSILLPWQTSQKASASLLLTKLLDSLCLYSTELRLSQLNEVMLRNDGFSLKEPRFAKRNLSHTFNLFRQLLRQRNLFSRSKKLLNFIT